MNIEQLVFLKEEVLVTELKQQEEKDNPFTNTALPQDKSDYVLYEVVKVGKEQSYIKKGDKVLISGHVTGEIKIKNHGTIPNVRVVQSEKSIFAVVC